MPFALLNLLAKSTAVFFFIVIPAHFRKCAGIQGFFHRLDSRLRGNDGKIRNDGEIGDDGEIGSGDGIYCAALRITASALRLWFALMALLLCGAAHAVDPKDLL